MDEITFWNAHVKPPLNVKQKNRVAWKVGTSTRAGIPDVAYRSLGEMAWIELKYIDEWPVRDTTPIRLGLSIEQSAHLRDWCSDGTGHGFVIVLIELDVYVLPWNTPDVIEQENLDTLALASFPLGQTKNLLARRLDALMGVDREVIKEALWVDLGEREEE